MRIKFISKVKEKSGVAIMSVMLFFTVMTIMLGALSVSSMSNARLSGVNSDNVAAFYAAEAGINSVVNEFLILKESTSLTAVEIEAILYDIRDRFHNQSLILSNSNGVPVTAAIVFENFDFQDNNTFSLRVVSTGQVQNQVRTLEVNIDFDYGNSNIVTEEFQIRHAVLVKERITTGNGTIRLRDSSSTETPKIATISSANNSINIGASYPDGLEIELTNPARTTIVQQSAYRPLINDTVLVTEMRETTSPEIRINFPEINFVPIRETVASVISSGDFTEYSVISSNINSVIANGGDYEIDHLDFNKLNNRDFVVTKDTFIITDRITLGSVNFSGEGMLTIYVRPGTGTFNPNGTNVDFGRRNKSDSSLSNENKLAIYVDTINGVANNRFHITFSNNSITRGYFMFDNARIEFRQNAALLGSIFTGAVNGSSSSINAVRLQNNAYLDNSGGRSLIVAPNGTVHMVNNSSLSGAVIARNFVQANGGKTTIRFDPNFPQKIPFEIASPIESSVSPDTNMGSRSLTIHSTRER